MLSMLFRSASFTAIMTILCCGIYPLIVTVLSQVFFHNKAMGSLISLDGRVVGSELIGQNFSDIKYFHGRISAAGEKGYDGTSSGGSNLGPTNKKLAERMKLDIDQVLQQNSNLKKGYIPSDLVTASASGLDPHISPEAASAQIPRIAKARGISELKVNSLVKKYTEGPQLEFLGEPVVNVLLLNLAMDGHEQF